MKRILSILALIGFWAPAKSQNIYTQTFINPLMVEVHKVDTSSCTTKFGMLVTDRGLNRFFADKIGSYLAEEGDISLFKNYATLDASDGKLSINYNFAKGKSETGKIRSLSTVGVKANIEDGFASLFADRRFNDELGITLKQTFIGKGKVSFSTCKIKEGQGKAVKSANLSNHKSRMYWERQLILQELITEMSRKATDFEKALPTINSNAPDMLRVPGDQDAVRMAYYSEMATEFKNKFAEKEAKKLSETNSFNLIKTNWTTLEAFIPVTPQRFSASANFLSSFSEHVIMPWSASLSHNRIWESQKAGRFFLNLKAGVFNNNNVTTEELEKVSLEEYKNLGGTDTLSFARLSEEEAYIGSYQNFISSKISIQGVWFPKDWNIGVSLLFEKNFGKYNPLNGKLGIPIRFNDKEGDPTVNFEIQIRTFDMNNSIDPEKSFGKKLSAGISVGLPFSSVIY